MKGVLICNGQANMTQHPFNLGKTRLHYKVPHGSQIAFLKLPSHGSNTRELFAEDVMSSDPLDLPILEGREEADTVRRREKHFKPLSLLPLVALIFYDVSGGPFGIEVQQHPMQVFHLYF